SRGMRASSGAPNSLLLGTTLERVGSGRRDDCFAQAKASVSPAGAATTAGRSRVLTSVSKPRAALAHRTTPVAARGACRVVRARGTGNGGLGGWGDGCARTG